MHTHTHTQTHTTHTKTCAHIYSSCWNFSDLLQKHVERKPCVFLILIIADKLWEYKMMPLSFKSINTVLTYGSLCTTVRIIMEKDKHRLSILYTNWRCLLIHCHQNQHQPWLWSWIEMFVFSCQGNGHLIRRVIVEGNPKLYWQEVLLIRK